MSGRLLVAKVRDADTLLSLARAACKMGFTTVDAHSPHAIEGMAEALDLRPSPVRPAMLLAGLAAALAIYLFQWWTSVQGYPMNIGGRPLNSWPAWLFSTFETGVLGAGVAGFVTMLRACGLPRPHHRLFDAGTAAAITDDGFFLTLDPEDHRADRRAVDALCARPGIVSIEVLE